MYDKTAAVIFGIIFMAIGIIGLLGGWGIVGPHGFFKTDLIHDLVHLVSGVLFLVIAIFTEKRTTAFLLVFAIAYGALGVIGLFNSDDWLLGVLINNADDFLHIGLAILILFSWFISGRKA